MVLSGSWGDRLSLPSGEYWPQWTVHHRCPRSVGLSSGLAWGGQAIPWGLGSIGCCWLGHTLQLLIWHLIYHWTTRGVGDFDGWQWKGTLCGRGSSWLSQQVPSPFLAYTEQYNHIFSCKVACIAGKEGQHVWVYAGSSPVAYGHFTQYVPAIKVCVELLEAKVHWQTLSFNISIVSFYISWSLTDKGDRLATLDGSDTQAILACICLYYDRLGPVIVHKGGIEECVADPGLEALEGCICCGVPVPFGKLFM